MVQAYTQYEEGKVKSETVQKESGNERENLQ